MLKRLAIVSLATLLGSAVQLSPAEFHGLSLKQEAAAPNVAVTEQTSVPEPTGQPPTPIVSEKPKPAYTPTPTATTAQMPDSTPKGIYVKGFGYVEYGGPNQCSVADSDGDINKMVGYMGDEPEPTPTPEKSRSQIHYPRR